jgi:hypothetical protein
MIQRGQMRFRRRVQLKRWGRLRPPYGLTRRNPPRAPMAGYGGSNAAIDFKRIGRL